VSNGEHVLGVSSISAPIQGVDEQMHYCLSVVGPTVRVQTHEKEFVKLVVRAAEDISRRYGFNIDGAVLNLD
jgi:DNA-binding IclR family transcriptional regulator